MLSLLSFSTLYPNAANPNHGVFVENRLRHLVATGEAMSTVLAPIPWFPSGNARFGAWAKYAKAPAREQRFGLDVLHPRFISLPHIGMSVAPALLYAACAPMLGRLLAGGLRVDAIDAHYCYPDGVAATWLGRRFAIPVVITARGSDVTQLPDFALPRLMIRQAATRAAALITVSAGLRDALMRLGVSGDKITVLRNGVDLDLFYPMDRAPARQALGLTGPTLLSVGALIPRKGHDRTIAALADLPGWTLLIAGEGPDREKLLAGATKLGVADRVRLLGAVPHQNLAALYSAADFSVLASSREGWANVLLESMACGTAVVASPIPGNPEVVQARPAGIIAAANTPQALAEAVRDLASDPPDRAATRRYADAFGWDATSQGQLALFGRVVDAEHARRGALPPRPPSKGEPFEILQFRSGSEPVAPTMPHKP